jgi:hypothetical protein
LLDKAYRVLVAKQSFALGRDAVVGAVVHVHERIENGSTGLRESGTVHTDGRLLLDWTPAR